MADVRGTPLADRHDAPRWDRPGIPHRGWTCTQVADIEEAVHTCEMCGKEQIRYVHTCIHPDYPGELDVGCVCVERMTEDRKGPRQRESTLKGRAKKRAAWLDRRWRVSRAGGESMDLRNGPNVGVFPVKHGSGWKYRIANRFSDCAYRDHAEAKMAMFDDLFPAVVRAD